MSAGFIMGPTIARKKNPRKHIFRLLAGYFPRIVYPYRATPAQGRQTDMTRTLDHGILNVPLAKRGNIDAKIDRYKADQARAAKAADKERAAGLKVARIEAKALLAQAPADRIAALAARFGLTPAKTRSHLASEAHWQPALIIKLFTA